MRRPSREALNIRAAALVLMAVAAVAGCASGSGVSPSPSPSSSARPGPPPSLAELKLRLVDTLGPRWYCDPDEYPIAHGDALSNMRERWPEVLKDREVLAALLAHEKLPADPAALTDDQRLVAYGAWKVLRSIALDPVGNGRYRFDYLAQPKPGANEGTRTAGTIDELGAIAVEQRASAGEPNCPICLARGSLIDTPLGPIAVDLLRIGDPAWTLDTDGRRIEATVIAVGSTVTPPDHRVIHLVLDDGRSVTVSPGHPLPDGRSVGELRVGDTLDGTAVLSADSLAYGGGETFDIVVSGPTGAYLAGGIPLASTLR